jgi:hypothetical protein
MKPEVPDKLPSPPLSPIPSKTPRPQKHIPGLLESDVSSKLTAKKVTYLLGDDCSYVEEPNTEGVPWGAIRTLQTKDLTGKMILLFF